MIINWKATVQDLESCTNINFAAQMGALQYTTPSRLMNNELTVKVYLGTWPGISSPLQAATAQPLDTRVKSI